MMVAMVMATNVSKTKMARMVVTMPLDDYVTWHR
jgi:hypothetical protein